jgi:5'-3' exonuclease
MNSKSTLPDWMPDLKEYLSKQPDVVSCHGFESDDIIRIWSREADTVGDPYVICSIDKDLDCIPGTHYTSKTRTSYTISKEYADKFFWRQCLTGDSVDNIPGIPGIGPVKADQILASSNTETECRETVVMAYKLKYGKDWWEYLMSNFRLLHMWRHMEDYVVVDRALYS